MPRQSGRNACHGQVESGGISEMFQTFPKSSGGIHIVIVLKCPEFLVFGLGF
jgi:hypothetical protein